MAEPSLTIRYSPRPGHLRAMAAGGARAELETHPSVRRAGETVRQLWETVLEESFEASETRAVIEWVVLAIDHASRDHEFPPPEGSSALTRFLVERVASKTLEYLEADDSAEKADVLRVLRGIDRVRQFVEPDWDRYFSSQISGPDGLNLVLEVAHDLRSPLTSIRCLAETIERGLSGPVTELQRRQLRLIYSASHGLGSMATDVIEMARRGDVLVDGELVPFSLSELLGGVADMVRPIAEEKDLTFAFQQLPTDQRIGLPFVLSRILLNLVTNALKFTDEGGVEVRLRATSISRVEMSVVDTGRGIPAEAIPDLFRPFRRSTARAGRSGYLFSGTGLGLALCRKLLRAMGSELKFETQLGVGTRFYFETDLPPTSHL
ncbi:MAG: HAMP domain-containing histidine kinase [Gemmatimonadaceae bacterium]|nr:HAMP domain-containing histidine kinase [Gemmatimonadaceae bacterium]